MDLSKPCVCWRLNLELTKPIKISNCELKSNLMEKNKQGIFPKSFFAGKREKEVKFFEKYFRDTNIFFEGQMTFFVRFIFF